MKKTILTFTTVLLTLIASGQTESDLQKVADTIVAKAKVIYDLENSAWISNDTILTKADFDKKTIDSYVSYKTEDKTICVFYSKSDTVLAEFVFRDNNLSQTIYDRRPCNQDELRLIKIKRSVKDKVAKKEIKKFKVEPNTTYNFVPIVSGNDSFCYLLNAVSDNTKVILGRDYKIKLDTNYNIIEATCNHKSIQELPFNIKGIKSFYHTHVLDNYFSETEIATIMLYKNYLPTDLFVVMSKKYTSIWNNTTMKLTIK